LSVNVSRQLERALARNKRFQRTASLRWAAAEPRRYAFRLKNINRILVVETAEITKPLFPKAFL
jgi:hypothetical protein